MSWGSTGNRTASPSIVWHPWGVSSYQQQSEPWFKIGRLEVTTTVAVVLLGAVSMLVLLFTGSLIGHLVYIPLEMFSGSVWQLFTWPLANDFGLWQIVTLALLWLFGRDLEAQIGRSQMLRLFVGVWGALTLTTTLVGIVVPASFIAGLSMVEFCILLLWIAEWPRRRFFFNIPAWVIGTVFLALQVLPLLARQLWGQLLGLLLSLVLVAVAARSVGLLTEYAWIPGGRRKPAVAKPRVAQPSRAQQRHAERRATDDERIDQLLDKINASGIHSLTKSERAELEKLRQRRR